MPCMPFTLLCYNRTTNNFCQENRTGQNMTAHVTSRRTKLGSLSPEAWYKWNIDVSRLECTKTKTISYRSSEIAMENYSESLGIS